MIEPRPLGPRKTVQLMVIVTILAWATQLLIHQWGFGAIILPGSNRNETKTETKVEQPATPTLELRCEATIDASEVTLRQICRWNDDEALRPLADVVVARLSQSNPVRQIGLDEIKAALHDAGANMAQIEFSGAATCAVRRSEVDDATFARLLAREGDPTLTSGATTQPSPQQPDTIVADAEQTPLRDLLVTDLCDRLKLRADMLQVDFDPRDEPTLILIAPRCRFDIDSQRVTDLGNVAWDVTIRTDTTERKATIVAKAQAWQEQLVLTRPLSAGQKIVANDIEARRALVDRLDVPKPIADASNLIGQLMARDMKRGDVFIADSIKAAPLVMKDQFFTVAIPHAGIMIETVARAQQTGVRGQEIEAKNEATGQVYTVIVTGEGAGEIKSSDSKIASTPSD